VFIPYKSRSEIARKYSSRRCSTTFDAPGSQHPRPRAAASDRDRSPRSSRIICPERIGRRLVAFRRSSRDATAWRVRIVTITSSQVFTTTRRHRTHLCLFSRRAHGIRMHARRTLRCDTVVSSLCASQQHRECRNRTSRLCDSTERAAVSATLRIKITVSPFASCLYTVCTNSVPARAIYAASATMVSR